MFGVLDGVGSLSYIITDLAALILSLCRPSSFGAVLTKSEPELRTMLHGEVGRRSRNVATGVLVERVDTCDVWSEVSIEKMRETTFAVTLQDHLCLAEMMRMNV